MSDVINTYIESISIGWQAEVCRQLDDMILAAIPSVEPRIQYRKPHYLKNGKYAAVFGTAKGWVSFTIFNATTLQPPAGMFEASDNQDRLTIKILAGQTVDYDQLGGFLKQAAETI
ncbi:MAG: DUF1801 domain-containing protein [Phototrophicaceae bacterium]|jgi:hypothetical protein